MSVELGWLQSWLLWIQYIERLLTTLRPHMWIYYSLSKFACSLSDENFEIYTQAISKESSFVHWKRHLRCDWMKARGKKRHYFRSFSNISSFFIYWIAFDAFEDHTNVSSVSAFHSGNMLDNSTLFLWLCVVAYDSLGVRYCEAPIIIIVSSRGHPVPLPGPSKNMHTTDCSVSSQSYWSPCRKFVSLCVFYSIACTWGSVLVNKEIVAYGNLTWGSAPCFHVNICIMDHAVNLTSN